MARIATSIEESKRLLELGIVPNTADMRWYREQKWFPYELQPYPYNESIITNKLDNEFILPAWSLVALLEVIPKEVKIKGQRYAPCLFPIIDGHWLYKLWYNSNEIIESPIAVWCDNPVDACYEMILKLHKNKLL